MPKFYVEMLIEFAGEIEADNKEEAEELAWESWGDSMDSDISYVNVSEIKIEEVEEDEDEDE